MRHFLLPFALLLSVSLAAQVPTYVPTDGLVAWYPFNGNANDESEGGNDGFVYGASLTTDRFNEGNSAYQFDGNNDFIDCGNSESVQISGSLTYAAWIQIDTYTNFSGIIGRGEGTGGSKAISMLMVTRSDNKALVFEISEEAANESVGSPLDAIMPGAWYHVAGVWFGPDQDSMSVFINGTHVGSAMTTFNAITGGTDSNDNLLKIGNRDRFHNGYSYGWFSGKIDDVGVWSRALNSAEITGLFLSSPPANGCTDSSSCNYNSEANVNDGSCIPSGCMEEGACNYNAAAECEGEACDYSCCPGPGCCGAGTHWDANLATCVVDLPDTVDAACTLMNLQELASGYAALVEQNAALDSLLSACEGDGSTNASGPCAGQDHVTYHGYDYAIVEIGDQCWFAENLRNSTYADGSNINHVPSTSDWANQTSGAWVSYDNDTQNSNIFGNLYNWFAVSNPLGICPADWHVPSDPEWLELDALAGIPTGELNGTGNRGAGSGAGTMWKASSPDWNGTDDFGFKAIPGGVEHEHGGFEYLLQEAYWWTASEGNATEAWRRAVKSTDIIDRRIFDKRAGMSVRCVKD